MPAAPLPPDEDRRLRALRGLGVLDTPADERFDAFARRAAEACGTPIALVSLVDAGRAWFLAAHGVGLRETPRDQAFCAHAILEPDRVLVVPDAALDERFADNPLVASGLGLRFYAGVPLHGPGGEALGTLCVIDTRPRVLPAEALESLRDLAGSVGRALHPGNQREAAATPSEPSTVPAVAGIGGGARSETCEFAHPFFGYLRRLGTGRFLLDEATDRPAFAVRLHEGLEARLPLAGVGRELALDVADANMLRLVSEAVGYVDHLALGDPLPPEVVTGAASWTTPPQYRSSAEARLRARLAHRMLAGSGGDAQPPSRNEVDRLVLALGDDPAVRAAAAEGELVALDAIGMADASAGEVAARLTTLSATVAEVLCLRDRVAEAVAALRDGARAAAAAFRTDTDVAGKATRLLGVAGRVERRLAASCDAAEDIGVGDIFAALKDPETACRLVAGRRNTLFREVRRLEAGASPWRGAVPRADRKTKDLLLHSYRLLARDDLPALEWSAPERKHASGMAHGALSPPRARSAAAFVQVWN